MEQVEKSNLSDNLLRSKCMLFYIFLDIEGDVKDIST